MKNRVYLASYPRSGNTWVRFLIANVYNLSQEKFAEVDFHNIHDIVPELSDAVPEFAFPTLPHVLKTHDEYRREFTDVILILRNPWDALYSYYEYLRREWGAELTLSDVVTSEKYGVGCLVRHCQSYAGHCDNLLTITYEATIAEAEKQLIRILEFMDLTTTENHLREAVRRSSFHVMREIEVRKGRKFGKKDFYFTRSGVPGEGVREISKNGDLNELVRNELKKCSILDLLYGA
jgi:hypothetical protein